MGRMYLNLAAEGTPSRGGIRHFPAPPSPLERQPPGVRCDKLVNGVRPHDPGAYGRTGADPSQRLGAFPQTLDALGGGEQRVIITHDIQDQSLVRLEDLADPIGLVR